MLEQLLSNEKFQMALIGFMCAILTALAQWVRSKFSSVSLIDKYWIYIQPLVDSVIEESVEQVKAGTWGTVALRQIHAKMLVSFRDTFFKYENAEPSDALIAAVSKEIESAATRAAEGVK